MNGRDRTGSALSGGDCTAFAPLVWTRLPEFVRASTNAAFWLEVGTAQRLLVDGGSVCAADALVVPLLPQTYASIGLAVLDCRADAVIKLPDVAAAVALVGRLAAVGGVGLIVEVPGLVGLGGLLPEAPEEDVEDALSDMVRAGLEAGADAVAVRGQPEGDVGHTVDAVLSLAEFYGAQVIGIDGGRGWSGSGLCAVSLLGRDGAWPDWPEV